MGEDCAGDCDYLHCAWHGHPYQACFQEWADAVAKKTNGGLVIDLYPSNTLGSEEDIINSFKDSDTNWGYNTDFARLGTYVPELAMFNLPYFVETAAGAACDCGGLVDLPKIHSEIKYARLAGCEIYWKMLY